MTTPLRMGEDWSHMAERILDLTLEIIYVLTGEDYEVVKKTSGQLSKPTSCHHEPIRVAPTYSLTTMKNNDILKVISKMIELLTGKEWQYIEGHKNLYKDATLVNHPPLTSTGGSSNSNPPERCTGPLCGQEDHNYACHHQDKRLTDTVAEVKKEDENLRGDQPSVEGGDMMKTIKVEEEETCVRSDQQCLEGGDIMRTNTVEQEEMYVRNDQQSMEEGDMMRTIKVEEETHVRSDKQSVEEGDLMRKIKEEEEEETDVSDGEQSMKEGYMMRTIKEEEDTYVRSDQQTMEEGDAMRTINKAETYVRDGHVSTEEGELIRTIKEEEEEIYVMSDQQTAEAGEVTRTIIEEGETCERSDQQTMEEGDMMRAYNEEEEMRVRSDQLFTEEHEMMETLTREGYFVDNSTNQMAENVYSEEEAHALLWESDNNTVSESDQDSYEGFDSDTDSSQSEPCAKRANGMNTAGTTAAALEDAEMRDLPSTTSAAQVNTEGVPTELLPDMAPPRWGSTNSGTPFVPEFKVVPGINTDVTDFRPVDFFNLFFTDTFLQDIVLQTNLYALQCMSRSPASSTPHWSAWTPTDIQEIRKFLGLTLAMGIVRKPSIQSYWDTGPIHCTPTFSAVMRQSRYKAILRFLQFNDNSQSLPCNAPGFDSLYKIRPVLDHFSETFLQLYTPDQEISVGETRLKSKGKAYFKQSHTSKGARNDIKLYKLCESKSGYTATFRVYQGKDCQADPQGCPPYLGVNGKIVWDLIDPLLNKGYNLYVENIYTSIPLLKHLQAQNTGACGTIFRNRKWFPQSLVGQKLKRGQWGGLRSEQLLALRYKERKDVLLVSTIHTDDTRAVRKSGDTSEKLKPVCFLDYNKNVGGVHLSDQLLQPYLIMRKSYTWYKKLAIYLFQVATYNSYVLYTVAGGTDRFLTYQEKVLEDMLFLEGPFYPHESEGIRRLTERHFISVIPTTSTQKYPQRKCRVCTKRRTRKDTRYYCSDCPSKPALCFSQCFKIYHTEPRY